MPAKSVLKFIPRSSTKRPAELPGAACRDAGDPEIFFREDEFSVAKAKATCVGCPLQATCLQYAAENEEYGIWGGATPAERAKVRKTLGWKFVDSETRERSVQAENYLSQGLTLEKVAEKFGCSVRTVYRFNQARLAWQQSQAA